MSIFGIYFVRTLLGQAGWPRKKSILGGLAYDTIIVDKVIDQMITWGASLGAGRHKLSLQIIAEIHRDKDWGGENAPSIKSVIKASRENWERIPESTPSEVIKPTRFSNYFKKSMPAKYFEDKKFLWALEQFFQEAIVLGLANPDRFKVWYNNDRSRRNSSLNEYNKAGLDVEASPPLNEWFEKSEGIIKDYERNVRPLPEIPKKLLQDAKSVGINID